MSGQTDRLTFRPTENFLCQKWNIFTTKLKVGVTTCKIKFVMYFNIVLQYPKKRSVTLEKTSLIWN